MRLKYFVAVLLMIFAAGFPARAAAPNEQEVRGVVYQIFNDLKSGNFSRLYDSLPDSVQKKTSRDKFVNALSRSRDSLELERMDVGAVRVKGDLAVADTVLYGRVKKPLQGEGKVVAQQYLVRQNGRWRVATGDTATINQFLKANPDFAKKFPVRRPQVFFKNERGAWVDLNSLMKNRKRP